MSLSSSLKEINANKANSEMDVMLGNPQTLGGRSGLKRAATEAVKRGKVQYRKDLIDSAVFLIVTGSAQEEFTAVASNEIFGSFTADPEDFFKNIVSRLDPKLFGRESPRNFFSIVSNILEDKMMELDVISYNPLNFSDRYNSAVNKPEDLTRLIRAAINDQIGTEIVGLNAVFSIVDKALEKQHEGPFTPIVLNTSDEKFALELKNGLKKKQLSNGTITGLSNKVFLGRCWYCI
jgi:hypothetical protein